jgi:hypothetical protein
MYETQLIEFLGRNERKGEKTASISRTGNVQQFNAKVRPISSMEL